MGGRAKNDGPWGLSEVIFAEDTGLEIIEEAGDVLDAPGVRRKQEQKKKKRNVVQRSRRKIRKSIKSMGSIGSLGSFPGKSLTRKSRGAKATSREFRVENDPSLFRGVPLKFLDDLNLCIQAKTVARRIHLNVAKTDISSEIRKGSTFQVLKDGEQILACGPFRTGMLPLEKGQSTSKPRSNWTVQDVSDFVISASTFEQVAAMVAKAMNATKPHKVGRQFQGTHVTYSSDTTLAQLVKALKINCLNQGRHVRKEYVHIHLFNQLGRVMETSVLVRERKILQVGIQMATERFDHLTLIVNSWSRNGPMQRLRCLWELYCMAKARRVPELVVDQRAGRALLMEARQDYAVLHSGILNIDTENTKCSNEVHMGFIQEAIGNIDGKFDAVNAQILPMVESWIVESTREAVVAFRQDDGVEILRNGDVDECAQVLSCAGRIMDDLRQPATAVSYYREAVRLLKELDGSQVHLAACYGNLGNVLHTMGKLDQALEYYKASLEIFETNNTRGACESQIASTQCHIGEVLGDLGQFDESAEFLNKSLTTTKNVYGPVHLEVANVQQILGDLYTSQGRFEEAFDNLEQVVQIRVELLGRMHSDVAEALAAIGLIYAAQGDGEQGLEWLRNALHIHRKNGAVMETTATMMQIAEVYGKLGDHERQVKYLHQAIVLQREHLGDTHPSVATTMLYLGQAFVAKHDLARAVRIYAQAVNLFKLASTSLDNFSPDFAKALLASSSVLEQQGETDLAADRVREALKIYKTLYGENHHHTLEARTRLEHLSADLSI